MRNPDRIVPLLQTVQKVWEKHPDLRLMQLLGNCLGPGDHYHQDDTDLMERLIVFYREDLS